MNKRKFKSIKAKAEYFQLSIEEMRAAKIDLAGFVLTPDELLAKRKLLKVKEAAYVLNVSPRMVRLWIERGEIAVTKEFPRRIPVEEVKKRLVDVDFWEPGDDDPDGDKLDRKALSLGLPDRQP